MNLSFKTPNTQEFEQIKQFIQEYELDNRVLNAEEFIIAIRDQILVGFGRLRKHEDCIELCSLGVIANKRRQGIGKEIVCKLIKRAKGKIYLVCIIPDYFILFGFKIIKNYPLSIQTKIDYCTNELVVPEKYVAMEVENPLVKLPPS